jgi:serine/threonine-protein kinase
LLTPASTLEDSSNLDPFAGLDLEPGDSVGEYVIRHKLGEGGFGAVYEATHPVIGKRAAVKVLHSQYSADEAVTSRFVAEARAVNQIRHKNIVDIFSFGDLPDGRHYYVMELLEGVPLDVYLDNTGRLSIEECLSILHLIAKALGAAHEAGIAHRDLKPENVFLEIDDEGNVQPKILDFGMAKLLAPNTVTVHKTRSGAPMGSPRYMSPEQCLGVAVDHRTDVYAFGCMAYRMLTGVPPFDASSALELMMAHVSTPPAPPSSHGTDINPDFDGLVLKMLEKQPGDRPQTLLDAYELIASAAKRVGDISGEVNPLASAKLRDLVRERERTLPVSQNPPMPRKRPVTPPTSVAPRRSLALPFVVAALSAGVGGFVVLRHARPAAPSQLRPPLAQATENLPNSMVTPSAVQSSTEKKPDSVAITVRSQPARADIYWNDRLLGTTPGPVSLPLSNTETSLILKANGYVPLTIPLKPIQNLTLSATLTSRPNRPAKSDVPHDLENPY